MTIVQSKHPKTTQKHRITPGHHTPILNGSSTSNEKLKSTCPQVRQFTHHYMLNKDTQSENTEGHAFQTNSKYHGSIDQVRSDIYIRIRVHPNLDLSVPN